jgi:hypothetical protein
MLISTVIITAFDQEAYLGRTLDGTHSARALTQVLSGVSSEIIEKWRRIVL